MLLLITYELKKIEKDYTPLYESIKACGDHWWHYLKSIWIVHTNLSPQECYDRIRDNIDSHDYLLVIDITGQKRQGWLPSKAWTWLKENQ